MYGYFPRKLKTGFLREGSRKDEGREGEGAADGKIK